MARLSTATFALTLALACVLTPSTLAGTDLGPGAAEDAPVVVTPVNEDTNLPYRLLVIVPGGKVPVDEYLPFATAVSAAANFNLFVAVPACLARLCNPADPFPTGLKAAVERVMEIAREKGFAGEDKDVFMGGHSLGGAGAAHLVATNTEYAGLALFGTQYNTNEKMFLKFPGFPEDLEKFGRPMVAVVGELDMMPMTHLAPVVAQFDAAGETTKAQTAIAVVPGMNHSQFCGEHLVNGDNAPEVSNYDAVTEAAAYTAAWMDTQVLPNRVESRHAATLLKTNLETVVKRLLSAFNNATAREDADVCRNAVLLKVGDYLSKVQLAKVKVEVNTVHQNSDMQHFHPSAEVAADGTVTVQVGSYAYHSGDSKTDIIPDQYRGARDITCKLMSAAKIGTYLGVEPRKGDDGKELKPSVSCSDLNRKVVEHARALVKMTNEKALTRYDGVGKGRSIDFQNDNLVTIGPQFIYISNLNFFDVKDDTNTLGIYSPAMFTPVDGKIYPGSDYCKLLSPAKAVELLMTTGLSNRV